MTKLEGAWAQHKTFSISLTWEWRFSLPQPRDWAPLCREQPLWDSFGWRHLFLGSAKDLLPVQCCGLSLAQLGTLGKEVDVSWQVEGVRFCTGEELREEVVFLNVLFWTNFPRYCCISFASVPASHLLGGKCRQVSFSVPQRWSRAWSARMGLLAEKLPQRQEGWQAAAHLQCCLQEEIPISGWFSTEEQPKGRHSLLISFCWEGRAGSTQ